MSLLPFGSLPPYQPREFVPVAVDLGDWDQISPLYDRIETLLTNASSVMDLETALKAWDELNSVLYEHSSRRYIAMSCHTDSPEAEQAYLHVVEEIEPRMKPRQFVLEKLLVGHPQCPNLPSPRYDVFLRSLKNRIELFRAENVAIETEQAKTGQHYQKLSGSLTVTFRDEETTLDALGRFLEDPDRAVRRESWELTARRRMQERENFENLFDQLLEQRGQIAANAGFADYREYAFREKGRFDYTIEDCVKFHDAVADEVIPLLRKLQQCRREELGIDPLRMWDIQVDPLNRPALKPFSEVEEMVSRTQRIFDRIDPELAAGFQNMQDAKLLDLANRKGKAPGGYQATLDEARLPFIFMNAVGRHSDVVTLLHEAGHAFHALAARGQDLLPYRHSPIEFCEVASMSMELLGSEYLGEFYSSEEVDRARRKHLEGIVNILGWIATIDAFQHWLYTHPGHSREDRAAEWNRLLDRFSGDIDWTGYEEERSFLWHRQLHLFLYPFYYVEYGIAQLGALQVWANFRQDQAKALEDYKAALALGGSRPLPELFAAAGCKFQFDADTIRPLMELLQADIARLAS